MEITREKTIFKGKYLKFKKKYFIDKNGTEKAWEIDVLVLSILPILKKKKLI